MRQQVASIMIQASTFSQRSLTDRFKGIWSTKQHDIACWPRRHLNMTQNVFFSSQRRRSTAELHRRVIVPLRPRFTKISFPLRFLLGTSLARVLQSDVQAQISSHDIFFLRFLHQILSSRGLFCLEAFSAICKRFSFFPQKQKPWTEDTGMEGLLLLPLLEQ